jgi:hypothetical protein
MAVFDSTGAFAGGSPKPTAIPAVAAATRAALTANQSNPHIQGEIKRALLVHVAKSIRGLCGPSLPVAGDLRKRALGALDEIERAIRSDSSGSLGKCGGLREGDSVREIVTGQIGKVVAGDGGGSTLAVEFCLARGSSLRLLRRSEVEAVS